MVKIIGICGGSGSGKTTLARGLLNEWGANDASLLSMDDYYKPFSEQEKDVNGVVNFDLPTALNISKFTNDLKTLKNGGSLLLEKYNFNDATKSKIVERIVPKKYLITEGIFLLHDTMVVNLLDDIIFIEAIDSLMLERRLRRDKEERNIDGDNVLYQWNNHFVPAYKKYVLPYKAKADLVLNGAHLGLVRKVMAHFYS